MSVSDVISLLKDEIYADEYAGSLADGEAEAILSEKSPEVKFREKTVSGIIKEY